MVRPSQLLASGAALLSCACDRTRVTDADAPRAKTIQSGVASFYGREFAGRETASGEPLKLDAMTAASRTLPIGAHVQVVNAETGQSARVRINDRGPYAENRVLDLTPTAAERIGIDREDGLAKVHVQAIQPPEAAPPGGPSETHTR